jgi:hypothetical protein
MFAFSNGEGVVVRYSKTASTAEAIAVELASTCVPSRLWPRFAHLRRSAAVRIAAVNVAVGRKHP